MPTIHDDRQVRIGLLGCGPIAQAAHLESVQKGRNVILHAVCDADQELARRYGTFYDARHIHDDYDAMLADPELEAVIIAISDAFHVPAARKALAAGKHVFCEKPVATRVEDVMALEHDVIQSGQVFRIGHMLRFDPAIQSAQQFIQQEMGQILALKAWYCDSTHRYTMTDAVQPLIRRGASALKPKGDPKADKIRYNMLAHGSHLVDLARYLAGPITAVNARIVQKFGAMCWFVETEFENGALGHLDLTVAVRMDWHEGFQVYGEHGSALAKIFNPWYYKSSEVDIFREADGSYHRMLGADGHFYRRQIEDFADIILGNYSVHGANIADGVASVRAMAAINQSARTGQPVVLADVTGEV